MTQTALYRHFDAGGSLLYVGVSLSAVRRLSQHADADWSQAIRRVEIEMHPTRDAAIEAERHAVRTERPAHNKIRFTELRVSIKPKPHSAIRMSQLSDYLESTKKRQAELANELGISPGHMHDIINGRRAPSRKLAVKIERLTGIPVASWDATEVA